MAGSNFQKIAFAVALWITLSTVVIVFNAALLKNFRHPITLIAWHMLVGSALILVIRLVKPQLLSTGDPDKGVPELTLAKALRLGAPVAFFHATSMIAGNSAYLYLNVSFIQMIKAWTSGMVYLVGCLMGTQTFSTSVAKTILTITIGLTIASYGELEFDMWGFGLQVISILLEGLRINLLEICLKSNGYKLNPLSSLQIFAPIMFAFLVPCALIWDRDALSWDAIAKVGEMTFLVNALCAFCLNLAVYLVIQTASGMIFVLGGVLKDLIIIFGSAIFMGTSVTGIQLIGYVIALSGLQAYGVVSKDTAAFERGGVLPVLWTRFQEYLAPSKTSEHGDEEAPQEELDMLTEDKSIGRMPSQVEDKSIGKTAAQVHKELAVDEC